jgi:hypothetical protein
MVSVPPFQIDDLDNSILPRGNFRQGKFPQKEN